MPLHSSDPAAETAYPTIRFDLVDLETFLAIADLGNFTLAAKRLCISQPSVTSRIQRIETILRAKLLVRTTRRVELTPDGIRLRDEAERVLRGMRMLIRDFHAQAARDRNCVVVASTPGIAAVTLPPLIRAFADRYPDVQVDVLDRQYEEVLQCIDAGEADLAVTSFDGEEDKYHFEKLAQEEMVLVVPSTHALAANGAVTLEDLAGHPLMTLERYTTVRDTILQESARRRISVGPIRTAANLTTLLGMVDAGNGLAFLPESMAQVNARHTRRALRFSDAKLVRTYGILVSPQDNLSSAARSFSSFLQESYAEIVAGVGAAGDRAD